MNPPQIYLRPANQEDAPFLLELRRQRINAYQLASGFSPSGTHVSVNCPFDLRYLFEIDKHF
jgi:hypothetical protein